MSIKKPWKKQPRDHVKALELHQTQNHWPSFIHAHQEELNKRNTPSRHGDTNRIPKVENETAEQKKARLKGNYPERYERMCGQLAKEKRALSEHPSPGVFYDGDYRVTMVAKETLGIRPRLASRFNLSHAEVDLLLNQLENFPNLRITYCFWTNQTRLVWDGGELSAPGDSHE